MRRIRPTRRLGVVVAGLTAAAIAVPLGFGSSHREAPNIMLDPAADNTDVYAFTAPDAEDALTVVSNWIPGQVPASGPNFFRWDDRARYYIKLDNNGDGKPDVEYQFKFDTKINNPNSFLYAGPGAQDYGDLNVIQRYDVTRYDYNTRGRVTDREKVGNNLLVAPSNVGPKTFPQYGNFVDGANATLDDGTKVFVGQREDPFFVDLGATFDAINVREGTGNEGLGKDDFSGMSTESIVLQIPEEEITRNGKPVAGPDAHNAVVGVWSTTERRKLELTNADYNKEAGSKAHDNWVQVSRLGNPLINEVIIPLGDKDKFNRTTPDKDAANYGKYVLKPELAAILNALFGVNAPETDREDLLVLLTGIEGVNQHSGKFAGTPVDTLKINLGTDPSAMPSRFGVIGGDLAGFPNGRRLADDVVDISLQVVAGILVGNEVPLGDGVDVNDQPFPSEFPYVGDPDSGFDSDPSNRIEPGHPPVPPGG
jgi:Domain of unknown function (DUF4331)